MNRTKRSTGSVKALLAVLTVAALGLAASPTALAIERGGPGQPGVQQTALQSPPVLPLKLLPGRSVSWSD
jgi:hypothetical protein